jgi:cytochrome b561
MPVSGFMMSALGGHGVAFFGLELVPPNPDPFNPQEVVAINASVASVAHEVHEYAGFVLILAVVLHVLGALKHHVVDHDGTLRRMLGAKI